MALGFGEKVTVVCLLLYIVWSYCGATIGAVAIVTCIAAWLWNQNEKRKRWKKVGISGPEMNLFFDHTFQLAEGMKAVDLRNHKKYGDLYGIYFFGHPTLMVSDLSMLRQILVKDFDKFVDRPRLAPIRGKSNLFGHILPALRGQHWKDVRSTITPAFSNAKLKSIFSIISECAQIAENTIDKHISQGNHQFDTRKILGNLVMDIVAKSAFGMDGNLQLDEDSEFVRMANKVLNFSFINPRIIFLELFPNVSEFIRKYTHYQIFNHDTSTYFAAITRQTIQERLKHPEKRRKDILQVLINLSSLAGEADMGSSDSETNNSIPKEKQNLLSEIELLAQCFIFITAGFETTTTTLQFIFHSLAVNPDVQQKAYNEIMNAIGDKGKLEYDDLIKLTYVDKVIMETLRMYPPVPRLQRECKEDITIDGTFIPKGLRIAVPVYAIHYNDEIYEEPNKFNPERFDANVQRDPVAYMPFGYGPRHCIGMRSALLNMRIIIASLIRKYKFSSKEHALNEPLEIVTSGLSKPAKPLFLHVEWR